MTSYLTHLLEYVSEPIKTAVTDVFLSSLLIKRFNAKSLSFFASSQKSTTIKSTACVVWILPLPLLRNLMKKAVLCWLPLTSRSAS